MSVGIKGRIHGKAPPITCSQTDITLYRAGGKNNVKCNDPSLRYKIIAIRKGICASIRGIRCSVTMRSAYIGS